MFNPKYYNKNWYNTKYFVEPYKRKPTWRTDYTTYRTIEKASDKQVSGSHYKLPIQPAEFCQKNKLNFCESNVVKYICRHKNKNGAEDIKKAIHYLELLLEWEYDE